MREPLPRAEAVTICVLSRAQPGAQNSVIAYEVQVPGIASGYGGQVLQRARSSGTGGQSLEIQLLQFPSARALDKFRTGGRRQTLPGERDRVIAKTELIEVRLAHPGAGP